MKAKALTSWQSPYGFIRAGEIFWCEESYGKELAVRKPPWLEALPDDPQPQRRQAFAAAPLTKTAQVPGKELAMVEKGFPLPSPPATGKLTDSGPATRAPSLPPDPVPPVKTRRGARGNAKRSSSTRASD